MAIFTTFSVVIWFSTGTLEIFATLFRESFETFFVMSRCIFFQVSNEDRKFINFFFATITNFLAVQRVLNICTGV